MKVKDLIKILQNHPQDTEVVFKGEDYKLVSVETVYDSARNKKDEEEIFADFVDNNAMDLTTDEFVVVLTY